MLCSGRIKRIYGIDDHFANVGKTSNMPNGSVKIIADYKLSRYACCLIAQNSNYKKDVIAYAQTYFVVGELRNKIKFKKYEIV